MKRHALALWFAMLALLATLRGTMAWRALPPGEAFPPQGWLWFAGAAGCAVVAFAAWWKTRSE